MDEELIRFFANDAYAAHSGITLLSAGDGRAVARLDIQPWHLNAAGTVQGGAIFTLCDLAFAAAVNSGGKPTVSVSASIQYYHPPRGKYITAKARVIAASRTLPGCTVDVFDEGDALIARFTGTGYSRDTEDAAKK